MKQASPLRNKFRAVIFFYRHLLSPIASSFGSGMPYAARTFLSHLKDASDRPEHCFRYAKVRKKKKKGKFISIFFISFAFFASLFEWKKRKKRKETQINGDFYGFQFTNIKQWYFFNFIYRSKENNLSTEYL